MKTAFNLGQSVNNGVKYIQDNFGPVLDSIGNSLDQLTHYTESLLLTPNHWVIIAIFVALGFWRVGWRFALFTAASFCLILLVLDSGRGYWKLTMITLAMTLSATIVSLLIGIPLGIWASQNKTVRWAIRPLLDLMQTIPVFVYLVPAAMFFGIGRGPGLIATVIFAVAPSVRLTTMGILQVSRELVEAGQSFGCNYWQLLFKVQLPNALPSIMSGVNQTIMMALSMVIIASMVGAGGLGDKVLVGFQRLNVGMSFEAGLAVVLLAIILDRITQSFGRSGLEERKGRMDWIRDQIQKL